MPGGRILIRIGLVAISIALQTLMLQHTVLDRDRVSDASVAALQDPTVQEWITVAVTNQVHPAIGLDPADTKRLAAALPSSRLFERGFQAAIGDLHYRVFSPDAKPLISPATRSKLSEGLRSAAVALGMPGDQAAEITLPFSSVGLPDLSWITSFSNLLVPIAGAIGLACLLLGLAVNRTPRRVVRRIGWSLGVNAMIPLVPFVIVPWIAEKRAANAGTAAFASIMHSFGRDLIAPAIALALLGAVLVAGSILIGSGSSPSWRQRPEDLRPMNGQFR